MRTIVYVDGYNFFYGRLKHTPYKWLDLYGFFDREVLHPQNPESRLLRVKYYTADIKANFASHGAIAVQAQQRYHQALESIHTGPVEITKGYYTADRSTPIRYKKPPDKEDRVESWKLEEKQTDVNIALDLYRDVVRGDCNQVVVVTNDTDIKKALAYIRQDFPGVTIGVVIPRSPSKHRLPSNDLTSHAHWVRHHINDVELERSQFPDRVPTRKKPVDRPDYW